MGLLLGYNLSAAQIMEPVRAMFRTMRLVRPYCHRLPGPPFPSPLTLPVPTNSVPLLLLPL